MGCTGGNTSTVYKWGMPLLLLSVLQPAFTASLLEGRVPRSLTLALDEVLVRFNVLTLELCVQVRKGCTDEGSTYSGQSDGSWGSILAGPEGPGW